MLSSSPSSLAGAATVGLDARPTIFVNQRRDIQLAILKTGFDNFLVAPEHALLVTILAHQLPRAGLGIGTETKRSQGRCGTHQKDRWPRSDEKQRPGWKNAQYVRRLEDKFG